MENQNKPIRYTLAIKVQTEAQRDAIIDSLVNETVIGDLGVIRAFSRDDLFEENEIYQACFSYEAMEKLKAMEVLDQQLLNELQWRIKSTIDNYIQSLSSQEEIM